MIALALAQAAERGIKIAIRAFPGGAPVRIMAFKQAPRRPAIQATTNRRMRDSPLTSSARELRLAFKLIEREVPAWLGSGIRWLRHPSSRWIRLPAGIILIAGGILSILPFLGIWMLPLGLMLIASDVPFLQRPMARFAMGCISLLHRFRAWRRRRSS